MQLDFSPSEFALERPSYADIDLVGVEVGQFGDGIAVHPCPEHLMQADMTVTDFEQCFELLGAYKQGKVIEQRTGMDVLTAIAKKSTIKPTCATISPTPFQCGKFSTNISAADTASDTNG